jgi:drug/metabolite transporter (DMT)-like permease
MWVKYKSYILLHITIVVWGFTAIIGKELEPTIDSFSISWYRMLIALVALAFYIFIRKESFKIGRKAMLQTLGTGLIIAAHWVFFFESIHASNVSVALACLSTGALFTALLEPLFFRRRIVPYELVFGLMVVGGLYLIFEVETRYVEGIIYALLSAFLGALFTVINGLLVKEHDSKAITMYEMLGGCLGISIYLAFQAGFTSDMFNIGDFEMVLIVILGLICTAVAFAVSVEVMKDLSPYTVSISVNMEPVYGIILALLFYNDSERMHGLFYVGVSMILLTLFANAYMKRRQNKKAIT